MMPGGLEVSSTSDYPAIKITWVNDLEDGISIVSKPDYSVPSPDYGTVYGTNWEFNSGELKIGDSVTYTFDKPGWFAYNSKSYPEVSTVRIYNPETQCTLNGCDVYHIIGTPLSEVPDDLELQIKDLRKQIRQLEKEVEIKYLNLDPNGYGTSEEIQDMESEIQSISQEITMLSKNDPDCIALDKYHQCVYETEIIEDRDTPNWFKTVITWYDEGLLTDDDFYYLVKYAIENNLIT